ncbi:MAG: CHASE3 domain-containing protein, partial [Fibrobacterales bacterium]
MVIVIQNYIQGNRTMFDTMKFKTLLLSGNALVLSFLVIISVILYNSISSQMESAHWVEHTHKVLDHTDGLAMAMVNMETGQRGFMLAGADNFLEPFRAGKTSFSVLIKESINLVSDNPPQVARFMNVKALK